MTGHTIYIINTTSECGDYVMENIITTGCTSYMARINPNTKVQGPFDIRVITDTYIENYTGISLSELMDGYQINLNCFSP